MRIDIITRQCKMLQMYGKILIFLSIIHVAVGTTLSPRPPKRATFGGSSPLGCLLKSIHHRTTQLRNKSHSLAAHI